MYMYMAVCPPAAQELGIEALPSAGEEGGLGFGAHGLCRATAL